MNGHYILETKRTYLRQICTEDFNELSSILGDIEVMYAWEHAFTADEIHDWIHKNKVRYEKDGYSYWAVISKETGRIIGVSGIIKEEVDHQEYTGIGGLCKMICVFDWINDIDRKNKMQISLHKDNCLSIETNIVLLR